jgi:hypothetical protein
MNKGYKDLADRLEADYGVGAVVAPAKYAPLDAIMDAAYEIWMEDQQLTDGDMTLWEIADTYMPPFLFPGPVLVVDNGPRIG